ncbi:hypothetical protein BDN72DRAFT_843520 [Pluteus cervinus]|uniref:Uncharacterized protein n=1 Tax=Pluteus cervinus TaxID=181527 RepID=A0ACD3ANM6_9AGAR|nr:hypothetical protein BDN72DRAFT_843520 [Pluteus cervinus]
MNQNARHTTRKQQLEGIVDLPNELWLNIMTYLYPAELYALGCISHRFISLLSYSFWHSRNISAQLFNMCMVEEWMTFGKSRLKFSREELSVDDFRSSHLAGSMLFVNKGMVFSREVMKVGVGWCVCAFREDGSWSGPSVVLAERVVESSNKIEEKKKHRLGRKTQSMATQTLRGFQIDPILLVPPFSHWTYQLIATSPSLTRLTLTSIKPSDSNLIKSVFTWLIEALRVHNVLTTLVVDKCSGLDSQTLLDFVNQLPNTLECLLLTGPYPYSESSSPMRIALPTVRLIQARWEVLLALVGKSRVLQTEEEEDALISLMKERFPALVCVKIEIQENHNLAIRWKR